MNLQQQMQEDVSVFLNLDEFAEEIVLTFIDEEGLDFTVQCVAIVDDGNLTYEQGFTPELALIQKTITLATENIPHYVDIGTSLTFKDVLWSVKKREDAKGVSSLYIEVR